MGSFRQLRLWASLLAKWALAVVGVLTMASCAGDHDRDAGDADEGPVVVISEDQPQEAP